MPLGNLAYASERREHRDEVHHRTHVSDTTGRDIPIVIVNISTNGLMARCEVPLEAGTRIALRLPDVGAVMAEVRWALGGRIGCEFESSITPNAYYALLPKLLR